MLAIQCAACGQGVTVDEQLGSGQPCPSCGEPVGTLPATGRPVSTALDDLSDGMEPIRFGAYSKAADAAWDDPMAPISEEQVADLVKNEAIVDNAVINAIPPEVEAKFRARQRENRKKLIGVVAVAAIILIAIVAFVVL